ncbi:hypothetical protein MBLNU230_g6221t1 [Neophaeotheca triangularis]
MKLSVLAAAVIFCAGAIAAPPGWSKAPGHGISKPKAQTCGLHGVIHDEEPRGYVKEYDGETLYITNPPGRGKKSSSAAILYLSDIYGLGVPNNKLLADSLAAAGYLVVVPDLFNGDPVPDGALADPDFSLDAWRENHPPAQVRAIINSTLTTMRTTLGLERVGAAGYCFGGPYAAELLESDGFVLAGFTAHPTGATEAQWEAVGKPISVAYGARDSLVPATERRVAEDVFVEGGKVFELALYAEAEHGFAVETDLSDEVLALAQESAFFQAVRWMDAWVKE